VNSPKYAKLRSNNHERLALKIAAAGYYLSLLTIHLWHSLSWCKELLGFSTGP
jgi:hypothetical protein